MSPADGGAGTCPSCGEPASGNFCRHCGAPLGGRFCNQCGGELPAGAKFCNRCGAGVDAAAASGAGAAPERAAGTGGVLAEHRAAAAATLGGANRPWWIAGAVLIAVILVIGWSVVRSQNPPASPARAAPAPAQQGGNPAMGPSTVDLSKMTPRQAADRLFNRIMTDLANGDTTDAMEFQPMAVQAYQVAEPLNLDGLFHESLLEALRDPATALGTAKRILKADPDHLLGLGAAARESLAMGDSAAALGYYKHFLKVYDAQIKKNLPEYQAHKEYLDEVKPEAQAFVTAH